MAIRIEQTVIDDLDASTEGVRTYGFALQGVDYEIDLSEQNLQRLRAALAPFVAAGRRMPRRAGAKPTTVTVTQTVRRWWAEHQQTHQLPTWRANGQIPQAVYIAHRDSTTG